MHLSKGERPAGIGGGWGVDGLDQLGGKPPLQSSRMWGTTLMRRFHHG